MKKKIAIFLMWNICIISLTSCDKKITEEDIKSSTYYIDLYEKYSTLKEKNSKLKEKNKNLEEETKKLNEKPPEEIARENVFEKIGRTSFSKVDICNSKNEKIVDLTDNISYKLISDITERADLFEVYTIEQIRILFGEPYIYTVYDEDNSVHEIQVYEGDFVVFSELQDEVYYSYGARRLGNAYISKDIIYDENDFIMFMLNSSLIIKENKIVKKDLSESIFKLDKIEKIKMKKSEISKLNFDKLKLKASYTFYNSGNVLYLEIYNNRIHIKYENEIEFWYKISKDDINSLNL